MSRPAKLPDLSDVDITELKLMILAMLDHPRSSRLAAGPFQNRVPQNRHFVTSVTRTCDALHTEIASARPVSDRSKNLTRRTRS
jgi:hypothetical protein